MSEPIIVVERLTKQVRDSTGTLTILDEIDFTLARARIGRDRRRFGIRQEHAALDHRRPRHADRRPVPLAGTDLFSLDEVRVPRSGRRRSVSCSRASSCSANLNALENVMLPLELQGRADARRLATEMLGRVGFGERLRHYPKVLSGGEQQRVALARAFVVRPAILLADEPTGSLDFATGETVMALMFELNREAGTTLVLVTHDRAIAARCDRQLHIEAGRVGPPPASASRPSSS